MSPPDAPMTHPNGQVIGSRSLPNGDHASATDHAGETQREPFVGIRPRVLRELAAHFGLSRTDRQLLTDLLLHGVDYRTGMWPRPTQRRQKRPRPAPLGILAADLGCGERTLGRGLGRLGGIVDHETFGATGSIVVVVRYPWLVHLTDDQRSAVESAIASFRAEGPDPSSQSELVEARETGVTAQTCSTDAKANGETAESGSSRTSPPPHWPRSGVGSSAIVAEAFGHSGRGRAALTRLGVDDQEDA